MRIQLEPVRGMRDLLPPDSEDVRELLRVFEDIVRKYGYRLVIAPTVELFSLFATKSGPEISKSMYVFKDKAGREVCLRPEFTASVARIYLKHLRAEPKPIKLYYFGSAFRYEEPQLGRYREFIQAGIEYIGDASIYSDLEQLLIIRDYYAEIGLTEYSIKLGEIGVLRALFSEWGVPEKIQDELIHYIDKKKLDVVEDILRKYPEANLELLDSLMSIKTNDPKELLESVSSFRLSAGIMERIGRVSKILELSRRMGIGRVSVDLGFARGLAYYTGLIYEVETPHLSVSIGGGGRYDNLISLYGGPKTPATGFSLGIDRTLLALRNSGRKRLTSELRMLLIALIEDYRYVDLVASKLRARDILVDVRFAPKVKVRDLISYASKRKYTYVGIIGEKERSEERVTIKNLEKKVQASYDVDKLVEVELP